MASAIAFAAAAHAEQDPQPGERVRVTCPSLSTARVVGKLVSATEQELVIERGSGPLTVRRESVTAIEKSVGRRARRGTRIGGAAFGAFLMVGTLAPGACACALGAGGSSGCCSDSISKDVGAIVAGGAAGYGLGSLFRTDRWERVSGPALSLRAAPTRGGARVALRIAF